MSIRLSLDLPADPEELRALLRDPHARARWQSSLRRVEDVRGDGAVGTSWTDVTWAGVRPRMQTTEDARGRWAETGTWRGWRAWLELDFSPRGRGTLLGVAAGVEPPGVLGRGRVLVEAAAARGIAADLRRAGLICSGVG